MNKKNNISYIILAIIVFAFGAYFVNKFLSPKPQEIDESQVLKWKPPKLKFADDSLVRKYGVYIETYESSISTQEEVNTRKDKFREEELDRIIPKSGGVFTVETVELPKKGFTKFIERYEDRIWSIQYLSHQENHYSIDGRNFFLYCRGDDGFCTSSFWDSVHGLSVMYDFWINLNRLENELENIVKIQREIEISIKKYYEENPQLIIKGENNE